MTITDIFSLAARHGLTPKRWSGSRLLTYNGFDHDRRVRKWQALDLAIRMGLEPPAEQFPCSMCGAPPSPAIAYHSEDYGAMTGHYPVCRSCHMRLHNRFRSPERWREFVAAVGDGSKWFEGVSAGGSVPATPPARPPLAREAARLSPPDPNKSAAGIQSQMHALRVAFVRAMGIKSQTMNPDPVGGYKLESDPRKRERHLDEARRLRNEYAEMVSRYGRGRDVLEKMDSNLANRDRCSGR